MTGFGYYPTASGYSIDMFRIGTGPVQQLRSAYGGDLPVQGIGIDTDGTLVGEQDILDPPYAQAIRYTDSRGTELLNDLIVGVTTGWYLIWATQITAESGEILGYGTHDGLPRAFRLRVNKTTGDVVGVDDLGISPQYPDDALNFVIPYGENASKEIVGAVLPLDAFVYTDTTGMVDLTGLIDPDSGWHLYAATAINDNHEVVGWGYHNGVPRAFKLTLPDMSPCPTPSDGCLIAGLRDPLTGICSPNTLAPAGTVCRASSGLCDSAETCDGSSPACPADSVQPLGFVCRGAADVCDVPETCDGTTKACPADQFAQTTTLCRASTGTCDAAEFCTGASSVCPPDGFAPATTVCRPSAGGCDVAETCTGTSSVCPADGLAAAGTVCRPAQSVCDVAETCSGTTATCPSDAFAAGGTTCGGGSPAPVCSGTTGTCPVSGATSDILGFEALADWAFDPAATATIVALNPDRTQGAFSFEVTAQNSARLNSAPMSSIGGVNSIVLLDIQLPTSQANPSSYGDVQMLVNSPSLGINNISLGDVALTGLALGIWQTLAFQMPAATVATLAHGVYSDLTFSIVLNVASTENGHYLLDNIRSMPDVVPSLLGIAQEGSTTKAIFDYVTTSAVPVLIPYGTGNGLKDQNDAFITSPAQAPPTTFVAGTHSPFVVTLSGSSLTWTIGSHSAKATSSSQTLSVTPLGDGTNDATLEDGRRVNLDSTPPASPAATADPTVGGQYFGTLKGSLSVAPSGAATYTVPISMPPGVAGMAPSLNLTYSSQGKDGLAGQGWDLSGTSMIHRCPKTRVQDGLARPITLPDNEVGSDIGDGVCLDGKRLFEVSPNVYKMESEDFSSITKYLVGSNWVFKIVTKTGQARYYGRRPETLVALPDKYTTNRASVWLLDSVIDQFGNYYELHYDQDQPFRFPIEGAYVTLIKYTGHVTTVADDPSFPEFPGTVIPAPNSISFTYDTRQDTRLARFHYGTLPVTKRLKTITTAQGTYTLSYYADDPLLPSRLQTIGYCNGPKTTSTAPSTACLDSLNFTWDPGNYGWQQTPDPNVVGQENSYAFPSYTQTDGTKAVVTLNQMYGDSTTNPQYAGLPTGVSFADLNGDGLVDLILSRDQSEAAPAAHHVWRNNGKGWSSQDDWNLPATLVASDGSGTFQANAGTPAAFLVDVDGDGLPDLVSKNAQGKPTIWYNRLKLNGGWVADNGPLTTGFPSSWGPLTFKVGGSNGTIDTVLDINGDGKADIVRQWANNGEIDALLNTPSGWVAVDYTMPPGYASNTADYYHFTDANRDGLPDMVGGTGAISNGPTILNDGNDAPGPIQGYRWGVETTNITLPTYDVLEEHVADVDGDGYYDVVESNQNVASAVAFGTGTDYSAYTIYALTNGGYTDALTQYKPNGVSKYLSLADVNGDGLADAVLKTLPGTLGRWGQLLINRGPGSQGWFDPSGATGTVSSPNAYSPPFVPIPSDQNQGGAWIDLNGDGLIDIAYSSDGGIYASYQNCTANGCAPSTTAWLNTFNRPIIKQFPSGLAGPTTVSYATITTADAKTSGVYDDSLPLATNTTYMAAPLRVVTSVSSDAGLRADGTGAQLVTTYKYSSLRADAFGRGPQGFNSVTVTEPSGIVTTTTYSQAYPYTGLPVSVTRAYDVGDGGPPLKFASTITNYCAYPSGTQFSGNPPCAPTGGAQYPPATTLFLYPSNVTDTTVLETGTTADRTAQNPETLVITNHGYDTHGNPTNTTVQTEVSTPTTTGGSTVEEWVSTTIDQYGAEGSDEQLQGKITRSTVMTQQIYPVAQPPRTHITSFGYDLTATFFVITNGNQSNEHHLLGLKTKQVEPGAGYPIELDTTYSFDPFGNIVSTQTCDNGVGGCQTTTASYDPSDFVAPQGTGLITSFGYQPGLFPVRLTNAAGHAEFFVYDPVFGGVLQHTGPNGITTCEGYDSFGSKTTETARCGSSAPITTVSARFRSLDASQPAAATVSVARPQTGAATWTSSDVFGRTVESLERNLNGSLTETDTAYDPLGRVLMRTTPALAGQTKYQTAYQYDGLGRVKELDQALGNIDGVNQTTVASLTTFYKGLSVTTKESVHGQVQQRTETKNAIGQMASVTDANGQSIKYQYDGDGNLVDVFDPNMNDVHNHYDSRGRKDVMTDPDMGTWHYCYDGFGDLIGQIDGKHPSGTCASGPMTVTMTYDALGRMTSKTDAASGNTAQWLYDSIAAGGAGIGKLAAVVSQSDGQLNGSCPIPSGLSVTGGNRAVKSYTYNQFGDLKEGDECVDGNVYATTYEYDVLGRQSMIRYPAVRSSQLAVGYHYTNQGFLQYLTDESSDYSVLWQAKAVNGHGQVTDELMENGVETIANPNPATGWLMNSSSVAHSDGNTLIQSWANTYDEIGNLRTRTRSDAVNDAPSTETFDYDLLNRLTVSRVQLPTLTPAAYDHTDNYGYDFLGLGNLTSKGLSTYNYGTGCIGSAGPHAVCSVAGGAPYAYDANGNMTSGGGRTVTYNVANRPTEIEDDSPSQTGTAVFAYGANGNRVLQIVSSASSTSRTVYVGLGEVGKSLYERTTSGGASKHTFFIYAGAAHGGNAFAVRILDDNGLPIAKNYFNFDRLGSTSAVSDEKGHVASVAVAGPAAGVLGYDPWGARRNPDGQAAGTSTFQIAPGSREFTGHETIPVIGLVNMNGRVYDPVVGRFLSPDPNVQTATDLQSYNRYSYVLNNPLRYTDPTGYFSISSVGSWLSNNGPGLFIGLAGLAVCASSGGAGCVLAGMVASVMTASVARAEGASWTQVGSGLLIGMIAGNIGGAAGQMVGNALGATAGSATEFASAEVGGAVGGAVGAVLSTGLAGGSGMGTNVLFGAAQGAAWAAAGWGVRRGSPLTRADSATVQGGGASGEDYAAELETLLAANSSGNSSAALGDDLLSDMANEAGGSGNRSEPLVCSTVAGCVALGLRDAGAILGAAGSSAGSLIDLLKVNPLVVAATILLSSSNANGAPSFPVPAYPGSDPAQSPGPDWTWKGRPGSQPGSPEGSYTRPNPSGGADEYLRPDLDHPPPIGPHWDWRDPGGEGWRIFPDGTVKPK